MKLSVMTGLYIEGILRPYHLIVALPHKVYRHLHATTAKQQRDRKCYQQKSGKTESRSQNRQQKQDILYQQGHLHWHHRSHNRIRPLMCPHCHTVHTQRLSVQVYPWLPQQRFYRLSARPDITYRQPHAPMRVGYLSMKASILLYLHKYPVRTPY